MVDLTLAFFHKIVYHSFSSSEFTARQAKNKFLSRKKVITINETSFKR